MLPVQYLSRLAMTLYPPRDLGTATQQAASRPAITANCGELPRRIVGG